MGAQMTVYAFVLVGFVLATRQTNGTDCQVAIDRYVACQAQVKEAKDPDLRNFEMYVARIDACFDRSRCGRPTTGNRREKPACIDQLKRQANAEQQACWSKHFKTPASMLRPIRLSLDAEKHEDINLDIFVGAGNKKLYKMEESDAKYLLKTIRKAGKCSRTEQTALSECLSDVFHSSGRPASADQHHLAARFANFCREHKACENALPPQCMTQLLAGQKKFCLCVRNANFRKVLPQYKQCNGVVDLMLFPPPMCDAFAGESFCRHSYADALKASTLDVEFN